MSIEGPADTLQIAIATEIIDLAGQELQALALTEARNHELPLKAAAAQALVLLARTRDEGNSNLDAIVRNVARILGLRMVKSAPPASGGLAPAARRRVQALITNRLESTQFLPPTLSELAEAAGLSRHHFVRAFRQTEGQTPCAQVMRQRIDASLALLMERDARVDEVADKMGFSSPSHFVSIFRRRMGVTPAALRDAVRALA